MSGGANFLYEAAFNDYFKDITGVIIQKNKILKLGFKISIEDKHEILNRVKILNPCHKIT